MSVVARRGEGFAHEITVRGHTVIVDEPESAGGTDRGPTPQELVCVALAGCTAITVEMYAERKGWQVGQIEVEVEREETDKGQAVRFEVTLRLPKELSEEQVERLGVIATKCPVHHTLVGEIEVNDRVELV